MDRSRTRTRRSIVAFLAGLAVVRTVQSVRAQATAGCEIGFVNGLLTIAGDNCQMFHPPLLGDTQVAAPSHLVGQIAPDTPSTAEQTVQEQRRLRRREHHQRKMDNRRSHKRTKRNRKQSQTQSKRDRRQARRISCDDFSSQKAAVEWLGQFPEDAPELDPDGDGAACENLSPVTCSSFSSLEDAEAWVALYGFTPARDPYNLFRGANDELCPALAEE